MMEKQFYRLESAHELREIMKVESDVAKALEELEKEGISIPP